MHDPVIFTADPRLVTRAGGFLEECGAESFSATDDATECLTLLGKSACPLLVLDARRGEFSATAALLLQQVLAGGLLHLNLVAITDDVLPVVVAAETDMLAQVRLPCDRDWSLDADLVEQVTRLLQSRQAQPVPRRFTAEAHGLEISTFTSSMFPVLDNLLRVSQHNVTLLIVGDTGTGKTTLAKFIHMRSPRRDRPFQTLACGALPADLVESELFGHARGAFTGADRTKMGRFQAAGRGTLLLDEIDVLDPKQQAKLLRVIETGEYEMVGSTETKMSEARLVVASNVNLKTLTETSQFRADLYYRLNVLEFPLPLLRDRPLDIVPMAMRFVQEFCEQHAIAIDGVHTDFLDAIKRYAWPGNIRELKNHIRRSVLLCEQDTLCVNDLAATIIRAQFDEPAPVGNDANNGVARPPSWTLSQRVAESEKEMLEDALRAHNDNRTATAKALGLSRVGLYKKLRRFGLVKQKAQSVKAAD